MSGVSTQRDTVRQKRERERASFRDLFLSLPITFCRGLLLLLLVKSSVVGSGLFFPVFFSSLALLCTCLYKCLCVCACGFVAREISRHDARIFARILLRPKSPTSMRGRASSSVGVFGCSAPTHQFPLFFLLFPFFPSLFVVS
jgi:hypothetical protein